MKFKRNRDSITLDFRDARPDELSLNVLIAKAEKQTGCFDAFVRARSEFADLDIFLNGWRESEDARHCVLRMPIGVRSVEQR